MCELCGGSCSKCRNKNRDDRAAGRAVGPVKIGRPENSRKQKPAGTNGPRLADLHEKRTVSRKASLTVVWAAAWLANNELVLVSMVKTEGGGAFFHLRSSGAEWDGEDNCVEVDGADESNYIFLEVGRFLFSSPPLIMDRRPQPPAERAANNKKAKKGGKSRPRHDLSIQEIYEFICVLAAEPLEDRRLELIQINSDLIPIECEEIHRFVPFIRVLQGQSNNNGNLHILRGQSDVSVVSRAKWNFHQTDLSTMTDLECSAGRMAGGGTDRLPAALNDETSTHKICIAYTHKIVIIPNPKRAKIFSNCGYTFIFKNPPCPSPPFPTRTLFAPITCSLPTNG